MQDARAQDAREGECAWIAISSSWGQARLVRAAAQRGRDPGATPLLRAYERGHRAASWPLYAGTNLLVRLYTDETMPARAMRHAGLRLGARLPFVRPGIRRVLMAR